MPAVISCSCHAEDEEDDADDDDEEFVDESGFLSDSEIDEVNKRIPELVAVEDPVEEDLNESEPVEDQSASASGG